MNLILNYSICANTTAITFYIFGLNIKKAWVYVTKSDKYGRYLYVSQDGCMGVFPEWQI
ncbi:hypothetical protein [Pseudomonas phage vB_Pa-PAC2]|nr:hypothetical protein Deiofobo_0228 [Pseudomonas phage Deifobo]WPK39938.1 hypothetical protein ETTORE_0229 [Pseudomonas phage Ettore]WPK40458.1 hypothetical protein Paride_0228 [Pseudomonas phage Paride]